MLPGDSFPSLSLEIAIDLETTGLSLADPDIQACGIGIGDSEGQYYFPLRHQASPESSALSEMNYRGQEQERLAQWLTEILQVPSRRVIFHNAAFDLGFLRKEFAWKDWSVLAVQVEDSMILATLLNENRSVSLEQLTRNVLRIPPEQKEKFQGFFQFYTLSPKIVSDYCCEDVWLTLNVWKKLTQHADCEILQAAYRQEIRFSLTLAQMELQGCSYSIEELKRIREQFSLGWENLLEEVYDLLPKTIDKNEFLRAPGAITKECIQLFKQFPIHEQPQTLEALQRITPLLESYDRLGKMLALFPVSNGGVVSPRYNVLKADGRLISSLYEVEKNPLSQDWELKKLIAVPSTNWLCEITFEDLFPRLGLAFSQDALYEEMLQNPLYDLSGALVQQLPKFSRSQIQELLYLFFFDPKKWGKSGPFESVRAVFETLFPHWIQCQQKWQEDISRFGFITSFLGRRRHLSFENVERASASFLYLCGSEFMKTLLNFLPQATLLQIENRLLLKVSSREETDLFLQQIPNPLQIGSYRVPFQIRKSFGKNWQENL